MNSRRIRRRIPILMLAVIASLWPALEAFATQNPEDQIPKIDMIGLSEDSAKMVQDAYEDAKKNPTDAAKIGELGMLLHRITKLNKAADCFDLTIKLQPGEMRWYYYLGMVREQLMETKEAERLFRKCYEMDPSYSPTLIRLADLIVSGDPKQAEALYQEAQKNSPKDPRISYGLGECARLRNQMDAALNFYKKAVEIAPQYAKAHAALARIYDGRGEKINADIHHAAEVSGRDPKVVMDPLYIDFISRGADGAWLLETANQLTMVCDFDLAAKFIARAAKFKLYADEANKQLGLLYYYRQDYSLAADGLSKYLREIRGDNDTRLILARALIELKRYQEAANELKLIVKSKPDFLDAIELSAVVSGYLGRPDAAIPDLQRALRIEKNRMRSHAELVVAEIASGNTDLAVQDYKTALKAFSAPNLLDEQVLISLLTLIRIRGNLAMTNPSEATVKVSSITTFAEALSRADFKESADRFSNYLRTVAGMIERCAANNDFAVALIIVDRVGEVDEGGIIRDALSRTIVQVKKSVPGGAAQFFKDNERVAPQDPTLASMMAWTRATCSDDSLRSGSDAIRLAEMADKLTRHQNPEILDTLAAANAETGNFERAATLMEDALRLPKTQESRWRLERFKQRLELYQKKMTYRS